ncbi:Protein of unknown function [Propionibacterium freudenreichii]|nr:Protein of unknown function [Propionibacterium freudenreichii]
MPGRTGLAG